MTIYRNQIVRPLRLAVLAVAPGSFCIVTPASADTRMGVSAAVGAAVETNPYLTSGGGVDGSGTLQIDPWLQISNEVSSLDVFGNLSAQRYTKSANGTDISGSLSAAGSHRISPYVSVSGGGSYSTSRNGLGFGFTKFDPDNPLPPQNTPLPDISLVGTRTRTQSISGNLGMSVRLSPLDNLGVNFTASHSGSNSPISNDFTYLNGGLNYSRTLSDRVSANASVSYGKSSNAGSGFGDGTIISPNIGFSMRLGPTLALSASIGASFARSEVGNGVTLKSTSLSGQASLCRRQERGAMCLIASRSAQPTALGEIAILTSISVNYDTRLSEKDTVSFSLGLNSNSGDGALVSNSPTSKYYNASANWSHSFNRRFSVYASPSYSRINNAGKAYDTFRVSAGLRYSFGANS